ncbi:MAG TPA: zf-HC2 domain-containing protein [Thalassobaculum sp.]
MSGRRGTWAKIRHWMQRSLHGWMTCEEFEATLVDYLDGMLGPLARRQVDLHIRLCPHCRRYLRAYDRTRRLAGAALRQDEEPALQAVPEDLVQAILAARRTEAADGRG